MNVNAEIGAFERSNAADGHVLADLGNQIGKSGLNSIGSAGIGLVLESLNIGNILFQRNAGNIVAEFIETGIPGNEVGFAVDFNNESLAVIRSVSNYACGGNAASLLGSLGLAVLAHVINSNFDVAVSSHKSLLAVHHAGAGAVTELLYESSGNVSHLVIL